MGANQRLGKDILRGAVVSSLGNHGALFPSPIESVAITAKILGSKHQETHAELRISN